MAKQPTASPSLIGKGSETRLGDGRGRSATRPSEIPAKGWKDILLRVYQGISDDRILANAAAVTFYVLLAIFPGIAALVSIYGLFTNPGSIASSLGSLSGVLPGGAVSVIHEQLVRLTSKGGGSLSIGFVIGLLTALWSANGGIKGLFDALNAVYEEKEQRSFLRLTAISFVFTLATLTLAIVALAAIIVFPIVLHHLPGVIGLIFDIARWPALLVLVAVVLAFVYRYGPSRTEPRWRWITWGSAFAALAWLAASGLFAWYAANFGTFNKTYGSLGAVVGFMMWIWISSIVVLIGGKLNAEIEHQTARESTVGPPRPLGQRGAKMADTVGPPRS
jgi:membrane protein